jgi:ABC-2 type transport system permease protein
MEQAQQEFAGTAQMYIKELWNLPIASILISFIVYFIGGYFLYSSFMQQLVPLLIIKPTHNILLPIIMPLVLSVYVGFLYNDPHGTLAVVFNDSAHIAYCYADENSFVPLWQIAISVRLFATFFSVVWFAAKIYRVGILMYGKKPTWKELYKWLKY